MTDLQRISAPVAPTDRGRSALDPLSTGSITLGGGFWQARLAANRDASLLHGAEELERAGNFHNFRVAAGRETGGYRGFSAIGVPYLFLDSDVFKWLEAVYWEIGRSPSPQLRRLADETVELLAAAQQDDGYLNSYFQITTPGRRFHQLVTGHELYCAGHLIQAGVAALRTVGDEAMLGLVQRNADCIYREFIEAGNPGLPAHPGIEMALIELYRVTGIARYLELACAFIDRRGYGRLGDGRFGPGYYQDHVPIRAAQSITGHAVMAMYLGCALADGYSETGDVALLRAVERQWEDMVTCKTYITGGIGSRYRDEAIGDPYELPADRAYCETCASIGSMMLSWRLLLASGDGRYADLIERTLYNGVLPGVSLDGKRFFYANPLQVRAAHVDSADGIGAAIRLPWFYCACCPPNVMRTLSTLEHCMATSRDGGLQLHQYIDGEIAVEIGGNRVRLAIRTRYPWGGEIGIEVIESSGDPWELALRVPGWSGGNALLVIDGTRLPAAPDGLGYQRIRRVWRPGDRLSLELPMAPRWTKPDDRIGGVRGCVALERGPLVYCFESHDQPDGIDLDCISVSPVAPDNGEWSEVLGGVVTLRCDGVYADAPAPNWPYHDAKAERAARRAATLLAVPYFAWANRGRSAMRVWVPEWDATTAATQS